MLLRLHSWYCPEVELFSIHLETFFFKNICFKDLRKVYTSTRRSSESQIAVIKSLNSAIFLYSGSSKDLTHEFDNNKLKCGQQKIGFSFQHEHKDAFDNCQIAFVPDQVGWNHITSMQEKGWKKNIWFIQIREFWNFDDFDEINLRFVNVSRPARRFLYVRYALTWMNDQDRSWLGGRFLSLYHVHWKGKTDSQLAEGGIYTLGKQNALWSSFGKAVQLNCLWKSFRTFIWDWRVLHSVLAVFFFSYGKISFWWESELSSFRPLTIIC